MPIIALAEDYPPRHQIEPHWHDRAQLVYAITGVMTVATATSSWLVPPGFAVWVPAGTVHRIAIEGMLKMRTLYVDEAQVHALRARACRVVSVPPLLHHLILRAIAVPWDADPAGPAGRLMAVLVDEIVEIEAVPLELALPRDRRALTVAEGLLKDPADPRTLVEWASAAGASERTLARAFVRETGMGFRAWRLRRRLLRAVQLLSQGRPVTSVAFDVGYDSPSAFVAAFHRTLGSTPRAYLWRTSGSEADALIEDHAPTTTPTTM